MNKLSYILGDKDQVVYLRDSEMQLDNLIKLVQSLFNQGIKFVGIETPLVKMYFDANKDIGRNITGIFRDRIKK